jgi:hypothetical protein
VRFCINFWIGHYSTKTQEFAMRQQEIEQEKKKLAAIAAKKEAYERYENSTPRVIEKRQKRSKSLKKSSRFC